MRLVPLPDTTLDIHRLVRLIHFVRHTAAL
jgi:hypothetical protein